ncbi:MULTISPECIES: alpha/beta family hydrolase [unclassified Agrococcus]|uniref:alpha/beta hydrolase family protein n=1 Tax=unclassified Agrococcus TaxID=2615065 RepID=UPI003616E3AD
MTDAPLAIPHADAEPIDAIVSEPDGDAWATVALAHGAGAGMRHAFMEGMAHALAGQGLRVVRFDFPYVTAGRRFPDRAPAAIAAWRSVAGAARALGQVPFVAAGKSFGGRMATMAVAEGLPADALVSLGYPLHAPGKPERLRDEHLYGMTTPHRIVQGTNDPFSSGDLLEGVVARIGPSTTIDAVEGGGHSFEVKGRKRAPEVIAAELAPRIVVWLRATLG